GAAFAFYAPFVAWPPRMLSTGDLPGVFKDVTMHFPGVPVELSVDKFPSVVPFAGPVAGLRVNLGFGFGVAGSKILTRADSCISLGGVSYDGDSAGYGRKAMPVSVQGYVAWVTPDVKLGAPKALSTAPVSPGGAPTGPPVALAPQNGAAAGVT